MVGDGRRARAIGQRPELGGECLERPGLEAVVGKAPTGFLGHPAGLPQHAEVVGDRGLVRAGLGDQVAGAERLVGQQPDDPRPERVSEQLG